MPNFDLSNLALKASCPTNEILLDNANMPSVMVYIPKFKISDVITGGAATTHPAFIVNGNEVDGIYISKFQNMVYQGRAYSLPNVDPAASLDFDTAKTYCEAKGLGWHLMTNAEWAAIALWCRANNSMPLGNNNYGKDISETLYKARPSMPLDGSGRIQRTATGTGPVTWSHDGTLEGIFDMNGNVWEWMGGYRTNNGEIQIIPNNDAAQQIDQSPTSPLWQAILQNGNLVAPNTANTLKWDYTTPPPAGGTGTYPFRLNTAIVNPIDNDTGYGAIPFQSLTTAAGVTVPDIFKTLAIYPWETGDFGGDYIYMRNRGERLAYRGGHWSYGADAGVFAFYGAYFRSRVVSYLGFRAAFVKL